MLDELKQNAGIRHIPVVILTNLGQEADVTRGMKLGSVDFLVKSNWKPDSVIDKIENILLKQNKGA